MVCLLSFKALFVFGCAVLLKNVRSVVYTLTQGRHHLGQWVFATLLKRQHTKNCYAVIYSYIYIIYTYARAHIEERERERALMAQTKTWLWKGTFLHVGPRSGPLECSLCRNRGLRWGMAGFAFFWPPVGGNCPVPRQIMLE